MDPLELCRILYSHLGRAPSLSELMAAMGAPSVGSGAAAGAEDGPLTALLRQHDAWDQQLVRMMFLGGSGSGNMLQAPGHQTPVAVGGHGHFLPTP